MSTKDNRIPHELILPILIAIKAAVLDRPLWQEQGGWRDKEGERLLTSLADRLQFDYKALPPSPSAHDVRGLQYLFPAKVHESITQSLVGLCLLPPETEDRSGRTTDPPPLHYTASTRAILISALEMLGMPPSCILAAEHKVSKELYLELKNAEMRERTEAARKEREHGWGGTWGRWAATGGGVLVGGLAIGLTGGLAAPALLPFLPLLTASTAPVVLGSLFGLAGGGLAGKKVRRRWAGVEDFEFIQIVGGEKGARDTNSEVIIGDPDASQAPSLLATIIVHGILFKDETEGIESARRCAHLFTSPRRDLYVLSHSTSAMLQVGKTLASWVKNKIMGKLSSEVLKRTALNAVLAAVALPMEVYQTTEMVIDNEWIRGRDKAKKAGQLLADVLKQKIQGERPVTLIGVSLGALTVFEALRTLESDAASTSPPLIDSAIFISLPAAPSPSEWAQVRKAVGRRVVNAYCSSDLVLAGVGRLHEVLGRARTTNLAGLCPVDTMKNAGVENVDVTEVFSGHFELNGKLELVLETIKLDE